MLKSPIPKALSLMCFGMNKIKSDDFSLKPLEKPSGADFSKPVRIHLGEDSGKHPSEGGLSSRAGFAEFCSLNLEIICGQVGMNRL